MKNKIQTFLANNLTEIIFTTIAVAIIWVLIVAIVADTKERKKIKIVSHDIVSIQKESGFSGSFFLGSGSIGSTQYFYFYEKVGDGLVLTSVPSSQVIVEEHSDIAPQYQECDPEHKCPFAEDYKYKLIVPMNTVLQEFKQI